MKITLKNGEVLIASDLVLFREHGTECYIVKNFYDGAHEFYVLGLDEVASIEGKDGPRTIPIS